MCMCELPSYPGESAFFIEQPQNTFGRLMNDRTKLWRVTQCNVVSYDITKVFNVVTFSMSSRQREGLFHNACVS